MVGIFVFMYPYIMSMVWIAGTILFVSSKEKDRKTQIDKQKYDWPPVSILVPCYNEQDTIEETIGYLSNLDYPEFEIIAINDGSKDNTGNLLISLADKFDKLRVIDCRENKGKANALHIGTHASQHEYLICIDSDAILDQDAPYHLIKHFLESGQRVGAVTGNPRIRNRDTLLGKLQVAEYASIIGSIKRTQRIFGKLMTVSGVIVAFRKKALVTVGLWDREIITEDIAVSWKLQRKFWDIRYEPAALCWMLVPEKLSGLWKQRVRWAQGGQEVILKHWKIFFHWKQRRLWPIYIEQFLSIVWSISWVVYTVYIFFNSETFSDLFIWIGLSAFSLTMQSIMQLVISLRNDGYYDDIKSSYIWVAWYPVVYWVVNISVTIAALPKSIMSRIKGGYAVWESPDRGERKKA